MAVASTRVQVKQGDDHLIAVKTETIVDPESGVAVEVEKAVVAVDLGDGRVAVQETERVVGAMMVPVKKPEPPKPVVTIMAVRPDPVEPPKPAAPKPVIVRLALPDTPAGGTTPSSQTTTPSSQVTTTVTPDPPKQATIRRPAPKPPVVQKQATPKVKPSPQGANPASLQDPGPPKQITRRNDARSQRRQRSNARHRWRQERPIPESETEDLINCCFCLLSVIFPPLLCVWIIYCITRLY